MGGTCCNTNNLVEQGILEADVRDSKMGAIETKFLEKFPKMAKVVDMVMKELPKNWMINRELSTKFKKEGVFVGKKNIKIRGGHGVMLYDVGFYYVGCWHDDHRDGMGIMIDKHGNLYKGEWNCDEAQGYGEYYDYELDWHYKGKWKASKKEGLGEQTFPDGTKYVGAYQNDVKHGMGKFIFDKKCYYEGKVEHDIVQGHGKQVGVDYTYEGPWVKDKMHGAARVQYFNQQNKLSDRYIGQFRKGLKHGYGEYRWEDGVTYKGQWINGALANKGVLIEKMEGKDQ